MPRRTPSLRTGEARTTPPAPHRGTGHLDSIPLCQQLGEVAVVAARIGGLGQPHHLFPHGCRQHVGREAAGEGGLPLGRVRMAGQGDDVGGQGFAAQVDGGVADAGQLKQGGLDLGQLDAVAAQLDLEVGPADELELA